MRIKDVILKSYKVFILFVFVLIWYLFSTVNERYCEITTPDKQYTIYAKSYRYNNLLKKIFPFRYESRYENGIAYLYDEIEQKEIGSGKVDMISLEHLTWTDSEIYFKGGGPRWDLPRKMKLD